MGRHAAADGAGTDPIVAAALAQQDTGASTRHATAEGDPVVEGGIGWPGDTTTGGGLGWPGSLDTADEEAAPGEADETSRIDAVPAVPAPRDGAAEAPGGALPADETAGPPVRRGWRRVFGGTAA